MPSGRSLAVSIDPTTGKLTIQNDDPANDSYSLNVSRTNLNGSKTTYRFNLVSDGAGAGAIVDLGTTWTGGAPALAPNNAPAAGADSYTTNRNTALTVAAPGVLANDTGGQSLTAVKVAGPAHGTLTLNANGSFAYTPAAGYVGPDSFSYKAHAGLLDSSVATVSIVVRYPFTGFFTPVANPPTLNQANAGQSIAFNFSIGGNFGLNILASGYPASQQVNCSTGAPIGAAERVSTTLALSYNPSTGKYTYTWKTEKKWAGACRKFTMRLTDTTDHVALFRFK